MKKLSVFSGSYLAILFHFGILNIKDFLQLKKFLEFHGKEEAALWSSVKFLFFDFVIKLLEKSKGFVLI